MKALEEAFDETQDEIEARLRATAGTDDDDLASRLIEIAGMKPADYQRRRLGIARELKLTAGYLDTTVKALRRIAGDGEGAADPCQRDALVAIGVEAAELWVDEAGARASYRVRSDAFRRCLVRRYGDLHEIALPGGNRVPATPGGQALSEAISALDAYAGRGERHKAHLRIAHHEGKVYLDLGDAAWTAIEVDGYGWRTCPNPPVRFVRAPGVMPLPMPQTGGSPEMLAKALGLEGAAARLVIAWVVGCYSQGPYPVLAISGEQGAGKTMLMLKLRRLVDPNKAPCRSKPKDLDDVLLAARNGYVVSLDNLSRIDLEFSDHLCRIATGAGFAKRRLYSDAEETLIQVCRPQMVNGIPDLARSGDLIDRAIMLDLPARATAERDFEAKLWRDFEAVLPRLLGTVLDAVACALRRLDETVIDPAKRPRMLDFARWAEAAAPALGWEQGAFLDAYLKNREQAAAIALEGDPFAAAVHRHAAFLAPFEGTATDLLARVNALAGEDERRERGWPKDATRAAGALKRAAPALRGAGVLVTSLPRAGEGRALKLEQVGKTTSSSSSTSPNGGGSDVHDDDDVKSTTRTHPRANTCSDDASSPPPLVRGEL